MHGRDRLASRNRRGRSRRRGGGARGAKVEYDALVIGDGVGAAEVQHRRVVEQRVARAQRRERARAGRAAEQRGRGARSDSAVGSQHARLARRVRSAAQERGRAVRGGRRVLQVDEVVTVTPLSRQTSSLTCGSTKW